MITKEQYLGAINIVDMYHSQLKKDIKDMYDAKTKILIPNWEGLSECRTRTKNVLLTMYKNGHEKYIEDVELLPFLQMRNSGKKSWYDFQSVIK